MNYYIEQYFDAFDVYRNKDKVLHVEQDYSSMGANKFEFYQNGKLVLRVFRAFSIFKPKINIDYQSLPFEFTVDYKHGRLCFALGKDFFWAKRSWFKTKLYKNGNRVGEVSSGGLKPLAVPVIKSVDIHLPDEKSNLILLISIILNLRSLHATDG
jgi:hypothetical protein